MELAVVAASGDNAEAGSGGCLELDEDEELLP